MRGHKGVKSTLIETYVLNPGPLWVRSPEDLVWQGEHVGSRSRKPHVLLGINTPNPMLALDPVEGPERSWAWFAEGPDEGGVVLGTSQ